jgi:hypothetical protein
MEQQNRNYYERREHAERMAASTASSTEAMRVHQQLADLYAGLIQHAEVPPRSPDLCVGLPGLVILTRD